MERSNINSFLLLICSFRCWTRFWQNKPKNKHVWCSTGSKKNRQTKDVAIQCTRSPRTVEVAVQTDIPDIMEDPWEQVKSPTKIVAELTEMKGRENIPSLLVLSDSDLTFINQDNDNFVEETPPHAPPATITSPIIVPEPQVPQPVSAPLSLHTYPRPQMRSPLSAIARNSQVFFTSPSLMQCMHTQFRRAESKETKFMIFELQQVQDVQIVIFKWVLAIINILFE